MRKVAEEPMSYDLRDIEKVPIVSVAKKLRMKLGFRGEQICGECPFRYHDDGLHEPLSLTFGRDSNTFRCASCDFRGSVLELVCYVAQLGPSESIEWIGENFCLPGVAAGKKEVAASPGPETAEDETGIADDTPTASKAYADFLQILGEPSPHAVEYMEGRGISADTLRKHGVTDVKGYHGTSNILKEKYSPELLRQAGLFDATGKLWFEEYPLILPYFRDGQVAFLQAHCMDSEKKPRYLRPQEAVSVLYNADVLGNIGDGDRVFMVEGIIDCLTLESQGYHAVSAPSMSNFRPEWVSSFRGLQTHLVHNGEADAERAAHAIAVVFAKSDLPVRVVRLLRGHDVNSFFAEGGTQPEFEHLAQAAPKVKTGRPILEPESRGATAEFLEQLRQRERRTKSAAKPFLGLDTGFPELTRLCGGLDPFASGQTCVVTGRPGVGKTTFCLQMARQILERNEVAVLYISYNEPRFVLRLKTLCQLSRMAPFPILRGQVQADKFGSAVQEMAKWGRGFFIVEGKKTTTMQVIQDYCQRIRSLCGEARVLVVVDHLEAVPCPENAPSGDARIETCASEFRFLSGELNVPVVMISSTAVHGAPSVWQGPRGGERIEYSEDLMLVLEREDEAAGQASLENESIAVKVRVAKNRYGGVGTVLFDFFPTCHYFAERERIPSAELISESTLEDVIRVKESPAHSEVVL
jgi:hypothetical protein